MLNRLRVKPVVKINSYVMPIHLDNGSTVVSSELPHKAMKQRIARLKRECKINLNRG